MIKVVFKNLEKSELASIIVKEKIEEFVHKFPELVDHKIEVFLSMENSFTKAGRDVFAAKVLIKGKKYGGLIIEKKDSNLYFAMDSVFLVLLENLNRKGDKARVRSRHELRKHKLSIAG